MLATIITIGDELLLGQTIDTNSAWLGTQLSSLGIEVVLKLAVKDTRESILQALQIVNEQQHVNYVFITGGLGPTKDDITKAVLCEYFNTTLHKHHATEQRINDYFKQVNRTPTPSIFMIANLPLDAKILDNNQGLAPGMLFEKNNKIYLSMPGVPSEMKAIFTDSFVPKYLLLDTDIKQYNETIMTAGVGESLIAEKISDIERGLPEHLSIAYLPDFGKVRLRITGRGNYEIENEVRNTANLIRAAIGTWAFGTGEVALEKHIGNLLLQRNWKLGIAESCTGGYLSHLITSQPGSSAYYEAA
jgi:Predicted nucleotide-utilizing enzyme related to molybdopterin-biosynthesis enzyme MoeA